MDDDTLQRYYDRDLTPLEQKTVEAQLASDPAARAQLARLERLSSAFRASADELASTLDSRALLSAIESQIERAPRPAFGERLRVIGSEWATHKRGAVLRVAAATAVAAATLLVVLRPSEPSADLLLGTPAPPVHGSRVEEVDFGTSTGTVFEIEDRGVGVAVVWIMDEEETP